MLIDTYRRDFRHFIDGLHTSLMQLAVGLISEMKLDRCPQLPKKLINSIVEDVEMLGFEVPVQEGPLNVGRRTALGIFYIATSCVYETLELITVLTTLLSTPGLHFS
jgi:hypothetical protein